MNLHATSVPALVIPWLWALLVLLRVDAVLLQECTPRHARWLQRRRRRWQLVRRPPYGEALYVRRGRAIRAQVGEPITRQWRRKQVPAAGPHPGRTLPRATLDGWLDLYGVHLPPGWIDGPRDRREAGRDWLAQTPAPQLDHLRGPRRAQLWAGDWQYAPTADELVAWRHRRGLVVDPPVEVIDHAATLGCRVVSYRRLRRGPGMDHRPFLIVVEDPS